MFQVHTPEKVNQLKLISMIDTEIYNDFLESRF